MIRLDRVVQVHLEQGAGTRTLLQVNLDNAVEADHLFTTLMGEKVAPRKDFIKAEARKVQNLDI